MKPICRLFVVSLSFAFVGGVSHAATFVEPTLWNVGDSNTTYQEWTAGGSNAQPLTGTAQLLHSANPVIGTDPVLSYSSGTFVTGSGGLYSFSGNYSVSAEIPSQSPSGASGTYIVVQAASTVNPDYDPEGNGTGGSLLRDAFQIYDSNDVLVDTSATAEVSRTFYDPAYPLFGGVGYEEVIWEVFVPGLVGDFRVTADVMVHASLQAFRVDSLVSVPEPGACALFGSGVIGLILRGYRRRSKSSCLLHQ